jgi:hypothetical protein
LIVFGSLLKRSPESMKVFISWSGEASNSLAEELRRWLPKVLQAVAPYVSSEDVYKGARWSQELAGELEESRFGILCVTPDNIAEPWLNFEAGALSSAFGEGRVAPLLFGGLRPTDLTGPLLQFQVTVYEKSDVLKLVHSINDACGEQSLDKNAVDEAFPVWWPFLDERLAPIIENLRSTAKKTGAGTIPERSVPDMVAEMLELTRAQQRLMTSPEEFIPPDYLRSSLRQDPTFSRAALGDLQQGWEDVSELAAQAETDPAMLPELRKRIRDLEAPVAYLSRRLGGRGRPPRRPSPEEV